MSNEAKTSSVVNHEVQMLTPNQFRVSSWMIIVFLIIALVVIKSFIYIKDEKRHGR
jgi:predicted nucleic acid-binding Zn ribbon protein